MLRLGVIRVLLGARHQRFHLLVELSALVVEAGELCVHIRVVWLDFTGLEELRFGLLEVAGILVKLGHLVIIRGVRRIHLDQLADDRLGGFRLIQLVWPVDANQVLQGSLLVDLVGGNL